MAIALDTSTVSTAQTSSPITVNHTCTGSNLLLIVSVHLRSTGGVNPSASAVTYNGVAMNSITTQTNVGTNNRVYVSTWMLHAPATGSNQISVTAANFTSGEIMSASYTGAQQSDVADSSNASSGTGTGAKTITNTTIADNCWAYTAFTTGDISTNPTLTTATKTERQNQANSSGGVGAAEDTNGVITPAGSTTAGWTVTGTGSLSTRTVMNIVAFTPASTGINPNVSDSSTTSENTQLEINSFISQSDSSTTSESTNIAEVDTFSVSDSAAISESAKVLSIDQPVVSDTAITSENVVLLIPTYFIMVSDASATSESIQLLATSFINKSDSTATSEVTSVAETDQINVSDASATSENIQLLSLDFVAVSDSSTTSENTQLTNVYLVNKSDSVATSETLIPLVVSYVISVSDSVTASENIQLLNQEFISTSDSVATTESAIAIIPVAGTLTTVVTDNISASENKALLIPTLFIATTDSTVTSENTGVALATFTPAVSVSDSTTTNENIALSEGESIVVSDSVSVTDVIFFPGTDEFINVNDSVVTSEFVNPQNAQSIMRTTSLTLTIPDSISFNVIKKDV